MKTNVLPINAKSEQSLIESFLFAMQIEGKSMRTIERYQQILNPFFTHVKKEPPEVKPGDLRNYLGHLNNTGYAKATVWTAYKNLHVFYEFLRREGYVQDNPLSAISKPKMPRIFPKVLSEPDIIELLNASKVTGESRFIKRRNYAILCLLFDSGLRASELCGLKTGDVSLTNQMVKVMGKGSKERIIPFSCDTGKALSNYLKQRGTLQFEDSFFVTKNGNKIDRYRLFKILKAIANNAGIDSKKVSPHVLRHSFATSWIRAGGDGKKLQALLGHSDGRIVDVYIHLTGVDLKQAHNQYSPLQRVVRERG